MKVLIIHKEPIIDRIPNLKSLVEYLSKYSEVQVITSKSVNYPIYQNKNIRIKYINENTNKYGLPTTVKVALYSIFTICISSFSRTQFRIIFAGRGALQIAGIFSFFGLRRYYAFIVEYPPIDKFQALTDSFMDRLELRGIEKSLMFITHDTIHGELINTISKKRKKYMTLPNATLSVINNVKSKYLHATMNIEKNIKIVLHSGGFGKWFSSIEIAHKSSSLPNGFVLIFHTSHVIIEDEYYKKYIKYKDLNDKSIFSMIPVSGVELDDLVSSAYIGIAWYDEDILGFRATYMGLAAGKIGHYLKCGIPVIAPNIKSLNYISEYKCGVLIDSVDQISTAIAIIDECHYEMSINAKKCYENLWSLNKHLENIVQILISGT